MSALADTPGIQARDEVHLIRLLIADDHPLILAGIRRTIDRAEDIEIVGEARCGPELLQMIERRVPDVVLTDLRMPGFEGSDCIAAIRSSYPDLKIVVLSASDDRMSIDAALAAGANAYVVKSATALDIAAVLRQASSGAVFHASPLAPRAGDSAPAASAGPTLTDREQAILSAVAGGLTTAAISREMWVSEHTVKFHLTNIYRKLGVANRASAIRYALEHGFAGG